jgi:hypothetical protein
MSSSLEHISYSVSNKPWHAPFSKKKKVRRIIFFPCEFGKLRFPKEFGNNPFRLVCKLSQGCKIAFLASFWPAFALGLFAIS